MPEPKDSDLPREERLFARVPKATNTKDESIGPGDVLTFREATFSIHQVPTLVPAGDSASMRITKIEDTGDNYGANRLYSFRWENIESASHKTRLSP